MQKNLFPMCEGSFPHVLIVNAETTVWNMQRDMVFNVLILPGYNP